MEICVVMRLEFLSSMQYLEKYRYSIPCSMRWEKLHQHLVKSFHIKSEHVCLSVPPPNVYPVRHQQRARKTGNRRKQLIIYLIRLHPEDFKLVKKKKS